MYLPIIITILVYPSTHLLDPFVLNLLLSWIVTSVRARTTSSFQWDPNPDWDLWVLPDTNKPNYFSVTLLQQHC